MGAFETIPAALTRAAALWPDVEALVDADERITFREYAAQADRVSRALVAAGIGPGDRVAVWMPNTWETAVVAMGVYGAGAVVVPVNTRFKAGEMAQVVRRAGARLLFVRGDFLGVDYIGMVEEAGLRSELAATVLVGPGSDPRTVPFAEFLDAGDGVPASAVEERRGALSPRSLSDVLFTSGTTGAPKGVMLCHGGSVGAYLAYNRSLGLRPGDRMLGIAPFFHCFGLKAGVLSAVLGGATLVPQAVFDVHRTADLIRRERLTVLPAPPPVWLGLLNDPGIDRSTLRSLRVAMVGAARFSTENFKRIRDELGITQFAPGYGLTEAHAAVTRCHWDHDFETISTTSGFPIPGVELRIVDDNGGDLPVGREGEILVRGYQVMLGYLDDPAATAAAIDPDGWLHTGDVGRIDDRGRLIVTDRKKDMFIVGGFNAYPAEIERILLEHPAIADVAVIGVPDDRMGEVGRAFVTVRDGYRLTAGELLEWARGAMANYKVPRHVDIVDDLPRNASGKALKHVLRERASEPGGVGRALG
jgi:acyl-CoA synthetase (AMP-forming)/AMP-acid ligase II